MRAPFGSQAPPRAKLSRRRLLVSAAATVALPVFDSLQPSLARAAGEGGRSALGWGVRRLVVFYVPNGIHMQAWTPLQLGRHYELPPILKPLTALQHQVTVLSGLANAPGKPDGPGDHAAGTGSFLTCRHVFKTDGAGIRNGISMDQVIARKVGEQTRLASLELGIEGGSGVGGCDSGYSCAYSRSISWASETQPLAKTVRPDVVFEQLFGGEDAESTERERERRRRYQHSVLDYVSEQARAIRRRLSVSDRQKLEQYLTAVREVEQRAARSYDPPKPALSRPKRDLSFPEQVRTMLELIAVALASDSTRVVTFMLGNAGSGRSYDFIGVSGGHHQLSHHKKDPQNFEMLTRIGTWEVEQYAYLLRRLNEFTEGERSLLDQSAVFFSSEIEDGNSHAHHNLPVLLAGSLGGSLTSGEHVRVPEGTPIANLFITLMRGMGVRVDKFGDDGTGPLA
jgi:hypothetical protein